MDDDSSISASDFDTAASATASPEETAPETWSAEADETEPVQTSAEPDPDAEPDADAAAEPPVVPVQHIPLDVHRKSLENARLKGGEEALAKWRAEREPQLQQWGQIADGLHTAPREFNRQLIGELLADPRYAAQTRADILQIAQQLTAQPQQSRSAEPEPDVQIVDEHGRVVDVTYSAKALARRDAQVRAQLKEELRAEIATFTAPLDKMRGEVEERERVQRVNDKVDQQLAVAKEWPGFLDHQAAIGEEVVKGADLRDAYLTVLKRDIVPGIAAAERRAHLAHQRHKATASTASPSSGGITAPLADSQKSWEQLFQEKAHLLDAAG